MIYGHDLPQLLIHDKKNLASFSSSAHFQSWQDEKSSQKQANIEASHDPPALERCGILKWKWTLTNVDGKIFFCHDFSFVIPFRE